MNLKFRSLAEAYNYDGEINLFLNDNLLSESGVAGFAEMKGSGFSGHGNLEENKPMDEMYMDEAKAKNNPWAICTASVGRDDKDKYEACVMDVKKKMGVDESISEAEYCGMEEVELTEAEKAIDEMIAKEELKGGQKKLDVNKNGKLDADDFKKLRGGKKGMEEGEEMTAKEKKFAALAEPKDKITFADKIAGAKKGEIKESKLSILNALKNMDAIIDSLTEGEVKKKV